MTQKGKRNDPKRAVSHWSRHTVSGSIRSRGRGSRHLDSFCLPSAQGITFTTAIVARALDRRLDVMERVFASSKAIKHVITGHVARMNDCALIPVASVYLDGVGHSGAD